MEPKGYITFTSSHFDNFLGKNHIISHEENIIKREVSKFFARDEYWLVKIFSTLIYYFEQHIFISYGIYQPQPIDYM